MALEAAYHYLKLAVVDGASIQALLLAVLLLLIIRIRLARVRTSTQTEWKQRLPPSPPGKLPIIGHLHLIGSHPHVAFRELDAKHGRDGLMLVHVGAVPTVIVSTPQAAEVVLRTQDHVLASRPRSPVADIIRYGSTDVAFAPYGEYWRLARKLVTTHLLSPKMVFSKRRDREAEVRLVVAKIKDAVAEAAPGEALDISEVLGEYTSDFVCRAVLGESHRKGGRNKLFRELTEISASLLGGFNLEDYFPRLANLDVFLRLICAKAKGVSKRWDALFNELLSEYSRSSQPSGDKEDSSEDFVHLLLSLQKEYNLSTDNIKAILVNMFEAAIETSFLVLEYSMAELMNNRHILAKLQKEVRSASQGRKLDMVMEEDLSRMPYLKATIKETMRVHPPAPFLLPHFSTTDCKVNGYSIPSGTRVIVNAWALARDPSYWERADEYLPDRFLEDGRDRDVDMNGKDLRYVPFGSGRRICAGANFAIATVEIMLANLIYHFDWELPKEMEETGAKVDMSDQFGMTLRRKEKLYLVPKIF